MCRLCCSYVLRLTVAYAFCTAHAALLQRLHGFATELAKRFPLARRTRRHTRAHTLTDSLIRLLTQPIRSLCSCDTVPIARDCQGCRGTTAPA